MQMPQGEASAGRGPLRVVLVDHQILVADALASAMRREPFLQVVANVSNSEDGFRLIQEHRPDIAILAVGLPGRSAFDVVRALSTRDLPSRYLIRLDRQSDVLIEQAVQVRPSGIVSLPETLNGFLDALRIIGSGGFYVSKWLDPHVYIDGRQGCLRLRQPSRMSMLTPRQVEVLRHLALGMSVKEVARQMHLSEKSVDSHKYRIMHRLDIHDRVKLARFAIREGLIEP